MKFFNIDLHISVIADIKNILENLGHQVDSLSLSGHSWVFEKENNLTKVINKNNWQSIDEEMCNRFYEEYKSELDSYDGFICAYPPAFSLLYEKFNKPIIVVSATRFEFPFTDNKTKWENLNFYLKNNKNIIKVSNNKFDKFYCELFTEEKWHLIPSLCEYTNAKYNNSKEQSLLFSKRLPINGLINKDSLGKYSWEELYSYKSIIHIPYNYSTMSIFEQYTANVPLLFPSKKLLIELFNKNLAMSEISFRQVLNLPAENVLEIYNDPNVYTNLSTFIENINFCDFYDKEWMPHLTYFDKVEELPNILINLNNKQISNKMQLATLERKEKIYKLWDELLNGI